MRLSALILALQGHLRIHGDLEVVAPSKTADWRHRRVERAQVEKMRPGTITMGGPETFCDATTAERMKVERFGREFLDQTEVDVLVIS